MDNASSSSTVTARINKQAINLGKRAIEILLEELDSINPEDSSEVPDRVKQFFSKTIGVMQQIEGTFMDSLKKTTTDDL